MEIIIIAALSENRAIGKDNKLLWHIPEDLQNFKKLTAGSTVLMGRKTFESLKRPLPNRNNIVISSSMPQTEGVEVCKTLEEGIEAARKHNKDIFIIGGANIYGQTLGIADKMFLSYVKGDYEADAFFPEFSMDEWEIEKKQSFRDFELVVYRRRK